MDTLTSSGNSVEKWKSVRDFATAGISPRCGNPDASCSEICYPDSGIHSEWCRTLLFTVDAARPSQSADLPAFQSPH